MRGGRPLAQDGVGLFWDIFDLHTGHGAIMALEAPVHNGVTFENALDSLRRCADRLNLPTCRRCSYAATQSRLAAPALGL